MSNLNEIESDNRGTPFSLRQLGLFAAMAPIALGSAYFLSYIYERAYSMFFKIPNEFIVIGWISIIPIAVKIFLIWILLLLSILVFWSYLLDRAAEWGPICRIFIKVVGGTAPMIILMVPFRMFWSTLPISVGFWIIVLIFFYLLRPLMTQKKIKGYRDKLIAQERVDEAPAIGPAKTVIRYLGGRWGFVIVFTLPLLILATHFGGINDAASKVEFLIPSTTQELVVLRIYGDNLICAPLDRENKEIERSFFILDMKDIYLTPEKVGPLTVSSNK